MMFKIARLPKKANLAGAKDAKLWVSIGNSIAVKDCQATEECFPIKKSLPYHIGRDFSYPKNCRDSGYPSLFSFRPKDK